MKRTIFILIGVLLIFSLVGCSSSSENASQTNEEVSSEVSAEPTIEPTPTPIPIPELNLNSVNIFDDYAELEVIRFETGKDIEPPNPAMIYHTFSVENEGNIYIDMITSLKYLGGAEIAAEDVLKLSLNCDGADYEAKAVVEDAEGLDLIAPANISPLTAVRVHYLFEIPESLLEKEMNLTVTGNEISYEKIFAYNDVKPEKTYTKVNDVLQSKDVSELTIKEISYANILEPSNAGGYYSYFEVKNPENTYLILSAEVKNLKSNDLRYDAIGSVSAVYDEKYNYKAFVVFEEDGGRNISTYTNLYALAPLVTNKVYFVAEIPAEAMEGNVELIVNYGGEKYYIIV